MNNGYNNFQQQPPQWQPPHAPMNDGKGLSVTALVMGILGIIGGFIPVVCYFTTLCAILGLIFGVIGRKKSKLIYGKASGIATAGLVLGIIGVAFAVIGLICSVICAAAICSAANEAGELANMMGNSYYW